MTDVNIVCVNGRLTKTVGDEPNTFGYLQNGTPVARMSIASNSAKKDSSGQWIEEVSYFDVTLFGKVAESLKPYLKKGQQISVAGRLKQDRWEKDGQKNSKVYILADAVQLMGGKNDGTSAGNESSGTSFKQKANVQNDFANDMGYADPSDIPF